MPSTPARPRSSAPRDGSGGPRRRQPRRSTAPRPAPRPAQPSALELALTEAAALPAAAEGRSFSDLGLPAPLVRELANRGITEPFAIQSRTLPDALAGRDLLGRAQTGSGKTLGFGLPVLARLAGGERLAHRPRGLVLVPTRELAQQVTDVLGPLGRTLGLKTTAVYGGANIARQIDALARGVDLVIATPGRLIDLLDRRACRLDRVEVTVLDEADHMADLGFLPAVTRILDETPAGEQRLLFSATLDGAVETLVTRYLDRPALHAIAVDTSAVEAMEHRVFNVAPHDKLAVTTEIAGRPGRTLVFVRTKHGADRLAQQLGRAGVEAAAIHGDLRQNARQRALDGFAAGAPRVLVATDVAARGIHVDDVDLVVHFDPPGDHKDYLHRSGRTARAGSSGTVLVLAMPDQVREVRRLHRDAGVTAAQDDVHPGHALVREVAESGTAPVPPPPPAPRPASAPTGHRRPPRKEQPPAAHRGQRPGRRPTERRGADGAVAGAAAPRRDRSHRPRTEG